MRGYFMSYALYLGGFMIVIGGLIYGATLLHVPTHWIVAGSIVLVGMAVLKGVRATRQRDPA
jgi:hypothetical protein